MKPEPDPSPKKSGPIHLNGRHVHTYLEEEDIQTLAVEERRKEDIQKHAAEEERRLA
jgi:hypothetical protein